MTEYRLIAHRAFGPELLGRTAPMVPGKVHLVRKSDEERFCKLTTLPGKSFQIGVILAGDDGVRPDRVLGFRGIDKHRLPGQHRKSAGHLDRRKGCTRKNSVLRLRRPL